MCAEINTRPARSRSGCRFEIDGAQPYTKLGRAVVSQSSRTTQRHFSVYKNDMKKYVRE
jgi:hypothetical protein